MMRVMTWLLLVLLASVALAEGKEEASTFSECRVHIEAALNQYAAKVTEQTLEQVSEEDTSTPAEKPTTEFHEESAPTEEVSAEHETSAEAAGSEETVSTEEAAAEEQPAEESEEGTEEAAAAEPATEEQSSEESSTEEAAHAEEVPTEEVTEDAASTEEVASEEVTEETASAEEAVSEDVPAAESEEAAPESAESGEAPATEEPGSEEASAEEHTGEETVSEEAETADKESASEEAAAEEPASEETTAEEQVVDETSSEEAVSKEEATETEAAAESEEGESAETGEDVSSEKEVDSPSSTKVDKTLKTKDDDDDKVDDDKSEEVEEDKSEEVEEDKSKETEEDKSEEAEQDKSEEASDEEESSEEEEDDKAKESEEESGEEVTDDKDDSETEGEEPELEAVEDEAEHAPPHLRPREHVDRLLGVDETSSEINELTQQVARGTLKDLKRVYESSVKPLEAVYKYKDISTRHLGDPELYSKSMILVLGPWASGKSTFSNYLLGTEFSDKALKTGSQPGSGFFNIVEFGETEAVLDGTELVAQWEFSSLQKFGQAFLQRLQGHRLPNRLLEKVTLVDMPGIIERGKQAERDYPFNDVCQWFIDRADLILVMFDPTRLDAGLELEALFDQLKGRESQVRIVLNKADLVRPQDLMRVQGNLFWALSPLLGSTEPPIIYAGSFWSRLYRPGAPIRLFRAQEEALLLDIRDAFESRVENRIALTRRHAVRVRNHAKMVDCYLNTFYSQKSFFANKKKVAGEIVDNPQEYRIYEGISTLTNVSRYDLPDPDIYRDFFRLHALYDFPTLHSTCTFFRGCPLDKLDIAISYDLPELLGKHRKLQEQALLKGQA